MRKHLYFVLRKLDLIEMMTVKPENVLKGTRCTSFSYFNAEFEREAKQKLNEIGLEFARTSETCFALAELYKFGLNDHFLGLSVPVDLHKAAYWMIDACDCGNMQAFGFLSRLVPEFFVEGIRPTVMSDVVARALEEQARLAYPGASMEERKRKEVIDMK